MGDISTSKVSNSARRFGKIHDRARAWGLIADLDVLPRCHVSKIVAGNMPYVFDRCSRQGIIANDFFDAGPSGLPGIFEYFKRNLARVNSIPAYEQRKMRYVFQTCGPDFFTRYLKRAGLGISPGNIESFVS